MLIQPFPKELAAGDVSPASCSHVEEDRPSREVLGRTRGCTGRTCLGGRGSRGFPSEGPGWRRDVDTCRAERLAPRMARFQPDSNVIYDSRWNLTNYLITFFGRACGILLILTQKSPFH